MSGDEKKIFIAQVVTGCHTATLESDDFLRLFLANGYGIARRMEEASVIVVNSCVVDSTGDHLTAKIIEEAEKRKKPEAKVIASGCSAKVYGKALRQKYDCIVISGPEEFPFIEASFNLSQPFERDACRDNFKAELFHKDVAKWKKTWQHLNGLSSCLKWLCPPARRIISGPLNAIYEYSPRSYFLRTAKGCANACAFCATEFAIGFVKSRSLTDIVREMDAALKKGFDHFLIVSDDFTSYGMDQGTNYVELLKSLLSRSGRYSVSLRNFNPSHCIHRLDEFAEAIEPGRIRCVELWLQSGSDRILSLMRRNYTKAEFLTIAQTVRARDPGISLKSGIIVGFPSETDEDFEETLRIVEEVWFERLDCSIYSQRAGTPAALLGEAVPPAVVQKRIARLRKKHRQLQLKRVVGELMARTAERRGA